MSFSNAVTLIGEPTVLRVHRADLPQKAAHGAVDAHDDRQQDSRVVAHGPKLLTDLCLPVQAALRKRLQHFKSHRLRI